MNQKVLDASAFIALINEEKGHEIVQKYLDNSLISAVNVSEISFILSSFNLPDEEIRSLISELVGEIIPFDNDQAHLAAQIKKQNKSLGLSLGDCACLALAEIKKIPVITADKIWKRCHCKIEVVCIR